MATSSRAIKAGEAFVSLLLDDKQFADAVGDWEQRLNKVARKIAPLGKAMSALGAAMAAPFVIGARHLLTYSKQLSLTSQRLGIAGEEFAKLAAVAQLTDVSVEGLEIGMKTIGERIMQLQSSSQETADAFKQLGINANEFINNPDQMQRLLALSDAFTKIEDAGLQGGLALRALGESGNRMLIMLRLGPERLAEEMEKLKGVTASQEQLDASAELFMAWTKIKLAASNLAGEFATALVPAAVKLFDTMFGLVEVVTQFAKNNRALVASFGVLSIAVVTAGTAMVSLSVASTALRATMGALRGGVWLTVSAFETLIPLLVTTEMHISGIGIALTPLGAALGIVGAGLAAFLVPFKYLSGLTWAQVIATGINYVIERLFVLISSFAFLPEVVRKSAEAMGIHLRGKMYGVVPLASAGEFGKEKAGVSQGPMITSGIQATFGSQQTLGFSAGTVDYASQTARNTATTNQLLKEQIGLIRDSGVLK